MKDARGMSTVVRTSEAKGVNHMGTCASPNTLKLAVPVAANTVIHLHGQWQRRVGLHGMALHASDML